MRFFKGVKHMKNFKGILAGIAFLLCVSAVAYADDVSLSVRGILKETDTPVFINDGGNNLSLAIKGVLNETDAPIFIKDESVMVSAEDLAVSIGACFYSDAKSYTIDYGENFVKFYDGGIIFGCGEESREVRFETAPVFEGGVLYVPLRETVECLSEDIGVVWKNDTKTVEIEPVYNFNVISKDDISKVKDIPVSKVVLSYNTTVSVNTITLSEKENVENAMRIAEMLKYYNAEPCECMPVTVNYQIYYENGEKADVTFNDVYGFDTIFEKVILSSEARVQTNPVFDDGWRGYKYCVLSNDITGDVILNTETSGHIIEALIDICRKEELSRDYISGGGEYTAGNYYNRVYISFSNDGKELFETYCLNINSNKAAKKLLQENNIYDKLITPLSNVIDIAVTTDEGEKGVITDNGLKGRVLDAFYDGSDCGSKIYIQINLAETAGKHKDLYGCIKDGELSEELLRFLKFNGRTAET